MKKYDDLIEYMRDILDKLIMRKDHVFANGFAMAVTFIEKFARENSD